MTHDALIFDLDGTLWDAAAASAFGWNLVLERGGLASRVTVDGIRSVSGNPFPRCVEILLPELHPASSDLLHALESGERVGIETMAGVLYPGVAEGLAALSRVYPLFLVSNCPDWYLDEFLRGSRLASCFRGWDCHGRSGLGKTEMLGGLVERHHLTRAVYVGDTQGDAEAAFAAGLTFAFAAYGFGSVAAARLSFPTFARLAAHFLEDRTEKGPE